MPGSIRQPRKILIVEDEWLIANVIQQVLEEAGYAAVKQTSVRRALGAITESAPDLAVLDSDLRGQSSREVAEALLARGIPFLVISGLQRNEIDGLLAGSPFLSKPFTPNALLAHVRSLCT